MSEMQAGRPKSQDDYDLERVIELFDSALTSKDERVVNALRSLLMVVTLTDSEDGENAALRDKGPLTSLLDDVRQIKNRVNKLESNTYTVGQSASMYDPSIAKMGTVSKSSAIDVLKKLSPK
ncbi:MAG TPA: hypothetical protein VFM18_18685 [Methanosarcina sp.]|nr:hypothetical protein [Methanosarcina sp.]